jgi:hypothetical protein
VGRPAEYAVRSLLHHGVAETQEMGGGRHSEEDIGRAHRERILQGDSQDGLTLNRQHDDSCEKGGALIGYDGHKRINGTKIHAIVTERSLPVAVTIGSAGEHEGRKLIPLMESVRVTGKGRPRKRPKTLYADTKYDMPLNRFYLSGQQADRIAGQGPSRQEEEARKAQNLRCEDLRQGQVVGGEVQRMGQIMQEDRDQIREAADGLHGVRSPGMHRNLSSNIAMSSHKESIIY